MKKEVKEAKKAEAASNAKTIDVSEIVVKFKQGRPMDPNSARQAHLANIAARGTTGLRGRQIDPNSARQAKLAGFAAKTAAGIELKRGRPTDPKSKHAAQIAEREAKIAAAKMAKVAELQAAGFVVTGI